VLAETLFGRGYRSVLDRLEKQKTSTAVDPTFRQALETPSAKPGVADRSGHEDAVPASAGGTAHENGEQEQQGSKKQKSKQDKKRKKGSKEKRGGKGKNPKERKKARKTRKGRKGKKGKKGAG